MDTSSIGASLRKVKPYPIPDESPAGFLDMPADLEGYWWETEHLICIPLVESHRKGAFSEWLATLEAKGKTIFIPTVVNRALAERLRQRGYVDAVTEDKEMGPVMGLALIRDGEPHSAAEILRQLKDLCRVKQELAKLGMRDCASRVAMGSILSHEADLLGELRAAKPLEPVADAELAPVCPAASIEVARIYGAWVERTRG